MNQFKEKNCNLFKDKKAVFISGGKELSIK
jgi:hypothetical protein